MPPIFEHKCDTCDFTLPSGWGGCIYVVKADGSRMMCPHPGERRLINAVIGRVIKETHPELAAEYDLHQQSHLFTDGVRAAFKKVETRVHIEKIRKKITAERTGFNSQCVCLDCLHQFNLDLNRDDRLCLACYSFRVASVDECVGNSCPQCREGKIEAHWWGMA